MRRAMLTATTATLALAGCADVREALSPGRPGAPLAQLALRVALAAPDGATLDLATSYVRVDGTRVPIGTSRVVLDSATTSSVPLGVDLAACLADDQARVSGELPGAPSSCRVAVTLRYTIAGTLRDVVTIGPLLLTPGVATPAPSSVTVLPRLVVRLANAAGTPLPPPGEVTVLRGQSVPLRALVTDSTLATALVRDVRWTSSNAGGASVTADGVVTGVADGAYTITATLPDGVAQATATVRVVPPTVPVTLALSGTGSGTVTPAGGAPCTLVAGAGSASCVVNATIGAPLVLTAAPGSVSTFGGFGGACTSAATTCSFTPTVATTVTAGFTLASFPVTITAGAGGAFPGRVRSADGAIDCAVFATTTTGSCTALRPGGSTIVLTASPDTTGIFDGWGGDCVAAGVAVTCTRTVTGPVAASARFAPALLLTVRIGGRGAGRIDVFADGVARAPCTLAAGAPTETTCSYFLRAGTVVELRATPTAPWVFTGFDAPCEVFGTPTCRFTLVNATPTFAGFDLP